VEMSLRCPVNTIGPHQLDRSYGTDAKGKGSQERETDFGCKDESNDTSVPREGFVSGSFRYSRHSPNGRELVEATSMLIVERRKATGGRSSSHLDC
jgi:hypothetical protein